MGVTEVVDGMDKAGPASIERQRHLLGVQSPLPAGKRYWAQVSVHIQPVTLNPLNVASLLGMSQTFEAVFSSQHRQLQMAPQ